MYTLSVNTLSISFDRMKFNASDSEFDPEYSLVAKGFQKSKDNEELFFGHLDFSDGQAVFQKVNLTLI